MKLYNGLCLPEIGAGTYPYKEELLTAVPEAVSLGYRLFDTSDNYRNETFLGEGLSALNKDLLNEIVIITKYSDPRKSALSAFKESSRKIFQNTVQPDRQADVYLMHWPYPYLWEKRWREIEELYLQGYCKAIGVCNFNKEKLERLLSICRVRPMINQFECHPMFQQQEIQEYCKKEDVQIISYSPLARINSDLYNNEIMKSISLKHGKSVSQIILKWNISEDRIPIPASSKQAHLKDNFALSDFTLSDNELSQIDSLERGLRIRFDPDRRFSALHKICFWAYANYLNLVSATKNDGSGKSSQRCQR